MTHAVDDATLLSRYAEEKAEEAFAEIVRRHIDVVYACALRRVGGDAHLAQDVAQQVFAALARDARRLSRRTVLAGWLFTATRFAAGHVVRTERRRRAREEQAASMQPITPDPAPEWERLRPLLDAAMDELGDRDREALWLRFFEGRPLAEVGARLRLTENAARMRVDRALDKMHALLARRGVTSTTGALAVALANQVAAAPAGLAANVTAGALAASTAGVGAWATVSTGFMSMTKLQIGIAAALALVGTAGWVAQSDAAATTQNEIRRVRSEAQGIAALRAENARLQRATEEAAALRRGEASLAPLREEIAAVHARIARREAAAAAARPRAFTGAVVEMQKLDVQPQPVSQTAPIYPRELRHAGVSGEVTLQFVIDREGRVHIESASGATHPAIETAAIEAVSRWKFEPGRLAGEAVNTRLHLPLVFTMVDDSEAPPAEAAKNDAPKRPNGIADWF